jgi:hypothetical protein
MDTVKGSCLCEAITFDIQGEPENVIQCFCNHCAKNAGAPYQYVRITPLDRGCFLKSLTVEIDQVAKFKVEQVQVTNSKGALKTYILKDTTSGFDKHKVFCDVCGCTLWTIPMRHGGTHYMIRTSLVDNG